MRAFIAVTLPPEIKPALVKIQERLRTSLPEISWVKPDNLHLSLKFLGEISLDQLPNIQQAIAEVAKTAVPGQIKLETPGVFPDFKLPKIIWLGTKHPPPEELEQIFAQLETKLYQAGFAREKRPFQAHITIGRIKHAFIAAKLKREMELLTNEMSELDLKFRLSGIALFQSVLSRKGPAYSILSEVLKLTFRDLI